MRRRLVAAVLVAGSFALTACGSTISAGRVASATAQGANGLGADGVQPIGAASQPGTSSSAASGLVGQGGGAAGPATGSPGAAASSPSAGGGTLGGGSGYVSSSGLGVGITPTTVSVGISYAQANNAALGAAKISQGDQKANFEAAIADINAHGGVAHRKLVGVYYQINPYSTETLAQIDAQTCTYLTQDHHVFVVLGGGSTDNFKACVEKAGASMVETGILIGPDHRAFLDYPDYYGLSAPSQDRVMGDEADVLNRLGYYGGWDANHGRPLPALKAKVGVLSLDNPWWSRPLHSVLLPALARAGHAPAKSDVIEVTQPQSSSQEGSLAAGIQSAVLRFRADGVTHVIVLDASGTMTLLFSTSAKNQGYLPRLGANSANGMQALYAAGVISSNQLAGAMGLGWDPSLDLSAAPAAKYQTAAGKHCLQVLTRGTGQTYPDANSRAIALGACDFVYFVRDVLNRATSLTRSGLQAAVEALGAQYSSTGADSTFFSATHHDGLDSGYDLEWDSGCSCAKYVGTHRIP